MTQIKEKGNKRKVKEIIEIVSVDPRTEDIKTNLVFVWNPVTDSYEKVNDSIILRKLTEARGENFEDVLIELERRKKVLEWLDSQGIKDYLEVTRYINMYYKEPEILFELVKEKMEIPKELQNTKKLQIPIQKEKEIIIEEKPAKKISILELLGFKMIREK